MVLWVVTALALALLSVAAHEAGPLAGDEPLTDAVQALPGLEPPSRAARALTGTQVVLVLGAVAVAVLWLARRRREAVLLAAILFVLPFAQAALKDIVDRPRPSPELVDRRTGFSSPSFPSGHVMSGTALYGYLLLLVVLASPFASAITNRVIAVVLVLLLLANCVANVYMGVHWPSDVLGGLLGALLLLLPAAALLPVRRRSPTSARLPSSVPARGE